MHQDELVIVDGNDYVEIAGPIRGMNPTTGRRELYHGTDVVGYITDDEESSTPYGGLTYASAEIGTTARYPVAFDGDDVTAALSSLPDGTVLYRVIEAPGNFRRVNPVTYRKVVPTD